MRYIMEIKPALVPKERHQIEDCLKQLGYHISGGGTYTDMSCCDISFDKDTTQNEVYADEGPDLIKEGDK